MKMHKPFIDAFTNKAIEKIDNDMDKGRSVIFDSVVKDVLGEFYKDPNDYRFCLMVKKVTNNVNDVIKKRLTS